MIDGAHVLTPGVLHFGMLGLSTYAPAVVSDAAVVRRPRRAARGRGQGLRRGLRGPALRADRMAGRRLPAVRHRALHRRPRLVRRAVGEQLHLRAALAARPGRRDGPRASIAPGGGFANLDFFERMTTSPRINLVTILGEGSFHQVHGGTTTNAPESAERKELLGSYGEQYAEIRGNVFKSPAKIVHYVGALPDAARRTKARRMGAPVYFKLAHVDGDRRAPAEPDSGARGPAHRVRRRLLAQQGVAADALARQVDRAAAQRPDRLPGADRRRAAGLHHRDRHRRRRARLLPGHDLRPDRPRPRDLDRRLRQSRISSEHPRIEYVRRDPADAETAAAVRELVGERPARAADPRGGEARRG